MLHLAASRGSEVAEGFGVLVLGFGVCVLAQREGVKSFLLWAACSGGEGWEAVEKMHLGYLCEVEIGFS